MISELEVIELLREAVAQPLLVVREGAKEEVLYPAALGRWSRYLGTVFPLWSLRPRAYRSLHDGDVPITHPLPIIVSSIVEDEGLGAVPFGGGSVLDVVAMIDSRRYSLMQDEVSSWTQNYVRNYGKRFEFFNPMCFLRFPGALQGPVLAYYEPDGEHTIGGYISPYDEIGLELVTRLERREASPAGSPERVEVKKELDNFLTRLTRSLPGRPSSIRDDAARRIVEEGARFVQLVRAALEREVELHPLAREILDGHAAASETADELAIRLVLPNLSTLEIRALRRDIEVSSKEPAGPVTPAHRFAIGVLAHRLRVPIATVARKVTTGWNAETVQITDDCVVCGVVHRN